MYIYTDRSFGQVLTPSTYGTQCLQDDTPLEFLLLNKAVVEKTLDDFYTEKSTLRTKHKYWIRTRLAPRIVQSWQTNAPIRTVILIGHTDEVGEQSFNYKLGLDRARAVRDLLSKEIERRKPGLVGKIRIETFSEGECWPAQSGGKKDYRNRRVDVAALNAVFSPPAAGAPSSGGQPGTSKPFPNLLDIPESVRRKIEEADEQRRFNRPVPKPPRGKSLKEWLDQILEQHKVPKWLRNRIWGAFAGGNASILGQLLDLAGIRGETKEAILGAASAGGQLPSR